MVRDSIEAKGDEDVSMEDVPATANGDGDHMYAEGAGKSQLDDAAEGAISAHSRTRSASIRDVDVDDSTNGDGEGSQEVEVKPKRGRRGRAVVDTPLKRLNKLIDDVHKYISDYEEK